NFGGGYNGQRLTLEVPGGYDAYPTFLHEVLHAFIDTRKTQLEEAVKSIDGLDYQTLNEGIALAFAPGLHPESADDPLRQMVTDHLGVKNLSDSPTRFRRFGLALRPLLKDALDDESQTLTTFVPRALDAWKVLQELDAAWSSAYKSTSPLARPSVFIMVPADEREYFKLVIDRLQGFSGDRWGRNHTKKNYADMTGQASPGDTFILLFSLDSPDRIPSDYEDLLPQPWKEVEDMLKREESVVLRSFARRMGILMLAARNDEKLLALIRRTDFPD
ncbi:MAG: hypothetical protein IH898_14480, partial [Planctomycetes bacterium]|nr:hypothetical protein [Planctomycetota bacterium]